MRLSLIPFLDILCYTIHVFYLFKFVFTHLFHWQIICSVTSMRIYKYQNLFLWLKVSVCEPQKLSLWNFSCMIRNWVTFFHADRYSYGYASSPALSSPHANQVICLSYIVLPSDYYRLVYFVCLVFQFKTPLYLAIKIIHISALFPLLHLFLVFPFYLIHFISYSTSFISNYLRHTGKAWQASMLGNLLMSKR